ncbi:MAG: hypothetical protein ACTSXO_02745 [Candidatus Heimdallarchaeota archaeon]
MNLVIPMLFSLLKSTIDPQIHKISFSFCPFIFGGLAIYGLVKLLKLEKNQKRERWWSISTIIFMVLVITFVGLNSFLWLNDLLFYLFIAVRFSLLVFLLLLANPHFAHAPFRRLFTTKKKTDKDN